MDNQNAYFRNIGTTLKSLLNGLKISMRHAVAAKARVGSHNIQQAGYFEKQTGIATVEYPHEAIPVPDNGRYRLHNEIDDCIVCDKCAKICPVNCIAIEPVRAIEEIGKTSDGTPKRIYAATFDINMAQCCFCGLCTTVCPTECLTMTKVYDFSVTDITEHTYAFAEMTPEQIADKKAAFDNYQKERAALRTVTPPAPAQATPPPTTTSASPKPVFKPRIKPPGTTPAS